MAADVIRHWDQGGSRWVLLEGRASVGGPDGRVVRSDKALIRLRPVPKSSPPAATVDVFAEGAVRTSDPDVRPSDSLRFSYTTAAKPRLRPLSDAKVQPSPSAPPEVLDLIARAFPDEPRPVAIAPPPEEAVAAASADSLTVPASIEAPPDPEVKRTQFPGDDLDGPQMAPPLPGDPEDMPDALEEDDGRGILPPTDLNPLPDVDVEDQPPRGAEARPTDVPPILPGTQRTFIISPRYGGRTWQPQTFKGSDGSTVIMIRDGVNIVSQVENMGKVDLAADHVVIWVKPKPGADGAPPGLAGGTTVIDAGQPVEVYLEGDVVIRQDEQKLAGPNDQRSFEGERAYYDFQTERAVVLNGEFKFYSPGLIAPIRTQADMINQYRPIVMGPQGRSILGPPQIQADRTMTTGSRFPNPGYRFNSQSVDISQIEVPLTDPFTGGELGPRGGPRPTESNWLIDARQNAYFIGPIPVFYWPRILTTDDLDPPIRNFSYRYGSYFGHQVLLDFSAFKLLDIEKPPAIDSWNLDVDYLSMRGPALGTGLGWFGRDLVRDLMDPYGRRKINRGVDRPYNGYAELWGIHDTGVDVLGSGPAVVTYGPPGAGKRGFQRDNVPSFEQWRGRALVRHMQSLLGEYEDYEDDFADLRLQLEAGGYSDRHFLEQYYKRLFDTGLDQDTLAYLIWQRRNTATTLTTQVNLMNWITDTQWLPKLEYYRIGDNPLALFTDGPLANLISYSQNWGIDYAKVHTAVEVNNPNIFAFLPFDPISNTSGIWQSGRAWTSHQVEMPLDFGFMRVVPYAQGQLMGWSSQLGNQTIGRAWGAPGVKADFMAWRTFPTVESELLNVHGLAHKVNFDVDYRNAFSTLALDRIGIQDQYDDDTYEFVRRYFALTSYVGGLLPPQYDPRLLVLRRAYSPIAFTPDIQDDMQTLKFGLHQRLQTKRGPEGRRRILDYMILDLQTIYYPNATRDNFGKAFGQNMYNFEWFIGDRTSIVSTGWFEFWDIQGNPILVTNPRHTNDPFGLNVVTAGVSMNRPPRGSIYIGYSVINTGPIQTSAVNVNYNYWLSPKWYTSFSTSYDFGNAILLGSTVSLTKIGPDFLTSVGLSVDPQRQNYTFGFELAPRFSPNVRLGSAVGSRFDSRFGPTQ